MQLVYRKIEHHCAVKRLVHCHPSADWRCSALRMEVRLTCSCPVSFFCMIRCLRRRSPRIMGPFRDGRSVWIPSRFRRRIRALSHRCSCTCIYISFPMNRSVHSTPETKAKREFAREIVRNILFFFCFTHLNKLKIFRTTYWTCSWM